MVLQTQLDVAAAQNVLRKHNWPRAAIQHSPHRLRTDTSVLNSHHKKKIEKVLALTTHVDSTSTNTMQKNAVMNVLPTRTTSGPACFDEPRSELYLFGKDQRRVGVNSRKTNDGTTGTTMSEWVGATRWALGSMWNFLEDDQIAGGVEKLANGSKPRTSLLAMPLLSGIVQSESKERLEMIDEVVTPSEEWIVRSVWFARHLDCTQCTSLFALRRSCVKARQSTGHCYEFLLQSLTWVPAIQRSTVGLSDGLKPRPSSPTRAPSTSLAQLEWC